MIGRGSRDAFGNKISSQMQQKIKKLRLLDSRSSLRGTNKNLRNAFSLLDGFCSKLGLPDAVKEDAAYIYRRAVRNKLTFGRSIKSIMTASVYIACKNAKIAKSISDIAKAAATTEKDIGRNYRILVLELEITPRPTDPISRMSSIASKLGIHNRKAVLVAIDILEDARRKGVIQGKHPSGLAAAALYMACIENGLILSKRAIARAASITDISVRNNLKRMSPDKLRG